MTLQFENFTYPKHSRQHRGRNGMVLIAALTCLLIATAIVGTMLQSALRARRQLHAERDRRQTELLLQAGADRAAFRLAGEPEFRGDVWNLSPNAIVGHGAGRVTTEISQSVDKATWQVRVVAEYPLDRDFQIRRSQTLQISPAKKQSQE